jgi:DNA polymerase III beta subunit
MKFLCDKNRLESAITPMLPAIQHKDTPKPGLRCVHIEASNEELILRATNMEISFETRIESVKVDQEGVGLVPAKQFHELLSTIHEPTVRIELTGDTLHLPTSSGDFELVTSDPEDFPGLSFESESAGIDLPVPVLKELLHSTEFACAREATRYAMNGLLVQIKDGSLHLVATDGRRLAVNGNPTRGGRGVRGRGPATFEAASKMSFVPPKAWARTVCTSALAKARSTSAPAALRSLCRRSSAASRTTRTSCLRTAPTRWRSTRACSSRISAARES